MSALKNPATLTKNLAEFDRTAWKEDNTPKSGWGPFPYIFFDDLPRLTRGNIQAWMMMYLCRLTFGLEPKRRIQGWPEWTPWVKWSDLAERCSTTIRTVQEEAHEAQRRSGGGLIDIEEKRGQVRFRLLWKSWPDLQSYKDVPRPVLVVDNKKPEPAKLLEKPFTVRAGRKSRPISIPGWEKEIAFQGGATDCAVSLFLESASRLLVETSSTETKTDKQSNRSHGADSVASSSPVKKSTAVKKQSAMSLPKDLVVMCARFGLTDDGAIVQLIADCQSYAPESTVAEITEHVCFVGETASPRQKNIAALIRSEVPKYFSSTAYREGIKPERQKDTMSERDRRAEAAWALLRKGRRDGK